VALLHQEAEPVTNRYYNNAASFLPGTIAKGDEVDDKFDGVTAGLDVVEGEINDAIRLTNADITTPQVIADAASARANKVVGFDATGALALKVAGADWKGNWTSGTYYRQNDIVKDAAGSVSLNSLFICTTAHTASGSLSAGVANWAMMIDVGAVTAAQAAAELAETNAEAAATSAAASWDSFDDKYLGAKASNPSLDNDNNALATGALYWNTAANQMRTWTGAAWVTAYVPESTYLLLSGGTLTGPVGVNAEYDAGDSGASKTITFSNGQKQKVRLTSATTLTLSFTGCPVGIYQLRLYNNSTGGYSVTWIGISSTKWIGSASAPSINGNADASTIVNFFWDGTDAFGSISRVGMV
jgi:hypothetical protein